MASGSRTVTHQPYPASLVQDIDRHDKEIAANSLPRPSAMRLERRRRASLRLFGGSSSPGKCGILSIEGLEEWARGLPEEDAEALVNSNGRKGHTMGSGRGLAGRDHP